MWEENNIDGMIEVKHNGRTIARMFPYPENVYVKLLIDGYDFACDSKETAKTLIKLRMGIQ